MLCRKLLPSPLGLYVRLLYGAGAAFLLRCHLRESCNKEQLGWQFTTSPGYPGYIYIYLYNNIYRTWLHKAQQQEEASERYEIIQQANLVHGWIKLEETKSGSVCILDNYQEEKGEGKDRGTWSKRKKMWESLNKSNEQGQPMRAEETGGEMSFSVCSLSLR